MSNNNTEELAEWVICDRCDKWRKLPGPVPSRRLPDKWYCEMNTWDLRYNSCSAPEEQETSGSGGENGTNSYGQSFIPNSLLLRGNGQRERTRSPSPVNNIISNNIPRPMSSIPVGNNEVAVPEKRYRSEILNSEPITVDAALGNLSKTLQQTMEIVADFQGTEEDEDSLFMKINEIVTRIEMVSKASAQPIDKDEEEAMSMIVPRDLLVRLDDPDGRNNPSLYTVDTLNGILNENSAAIQAIAKLKSLASDLETKSIGGKQAKLK